MQNFYTKTNQGFTLIELMIVMVIMGVLATIGVGSFISSQKKSRDAKRKSELRQVAQALEAYYNDNSAYPTGNTTDGRIKVCDATGENGGALECTWGTSPFKSSSNTTTYMIKLPKDPKSDWRYYYRKTTTNKWYQLYARLENDQDADYVSSATYPNCDSLNSLKCTYGISSPDTTP